MAIDTSHAFKDVGRVVTHSDEARTSGPFTAQHHFVDGKKSFITLQMEHEFGPGTYSFPAGRIANSVIVCMIRANLDACVYQDKHGANFKLPCPKEVLEWLTEYEAS